jgi:hypothetical protein
MRVRMVVISQELELVKNLLLRETNVSYWIKVQARNKESQSTYLFTSEFFTDTGLDHFKDFSIRTSDEMHQ